MIGTEKVIKDLKDRLENCQILLMQNPQNKCLWLEERDLQDQIGHISLRRKYIGPNEHTRVDTIVAEIPDVSNGGYNKKAIQYSQKNKCPTRKLV